MKILLSLLTAGVLLFLNFNSVQAAISVTHSPINADDATLDTITITGLTPRVIYEVVLDDPWNDGDDNLRDAFSGETEFQIFSDGQVITFTSICENGEFNRVEGVGDGECEDNFQAALYPFKIKIAGTDTVVYTGAVAVAAAGFSPPPTPCPEGQECPTALGNISTNPGGFAEQILFFATFTGGGIAFILMVIGGIRMLVSGGDPEALATGRDMLTSAIVGLLFIMFSVVLLRIIGIDILKIPGLTPGGPPVAPP